MKWNFVAMTGLALLVVGCSDDSSGPGGTVGDQALVSLTASAYGTNGHITIGKIGGENTTLAAVDSIKIEQAVIILKDIAFKGRIDTVQTMDSIQVEHEYELEGEYDRTHGPGGMDYDHFRFPGMHFRGPFVVVLQDTTPVQIALDTIPPGTYNGIKFKIHRLRSRDVQRDPALPDTMIGYSTAVSGSVKYSNGDWTPFVFKANIDEEFKARGNFVVNPGDRLVPYALKFDLGSWFTTPGGRILDPNDWMDRRWIRFLIKASLKDRMWCGRDGNHDGYPD